MASGRARHLRKNATEAEKKLWAVLRRRQVAGARFRRQAPIGPYVADFVCFSHSLVVELDGSQHLERREHDAKRTEWLETQGFRVIRFWNSEAFDNLEGVVEAIRDALRASRPHPDPPPQGGRD
jgi:very-short-patch-repair endonuclease